MHRTLLLITITIYLLSGSCVRDEEIRFGFDTFFGTRSQGVSIMNVGKSAGTVYLTGDITVTGGELVVELISPGDEPIFTRNVTSPGSGHISESFSAAPGNWKLKYKSIEGTGTIRLHLSSGKQKK